MDFTQLDINAIITGQTDGGVRYLELFLKEYTSIFSEAVNPGCNKCLTTYLEKYKKHFYKMSNTTGYILKAKYENLPLEFGSPILVNNGNITEEYARKLLEHPDGERYFESMPEQIEDAEADKLKAAVIKARAKVDGLTPDAKKQVVTLANNALTKAQKALEDYKETLAKKTEQEDVDQDAANEIEVILTAEDVENPELAEAGFKAGDVVVADANDYNDGVLTILRLKNEVTPE